MNSLDFMESNNKALRFYHD